MASYKWRIYDDLIALVPAGEVVRNIWMGSYWIMVESSGGGYGLAQNVSGQVADSAGEHIGRPVKEVASLMKSWNFQEAAVGLAALNTRGQSAQARDGDAFEHFMAQIKGRKVAVIGHFPYLEKLRSQCASLVVLERQPREGDLPDSAAEYILPEREVVFITSTTLINKTLPRLLELCSGAKVGLVGPSTPLLPELFRHGVAALSGLVVTDPAMMAPVVKEGGSCIGLFAQGTRKVNLVG